MIKLSACSQNRCCQKAHFSGHTGVDIGLGTGFRIRVHTHPKAVELSRAFGGVVPEDAKSRGEGSEDRKGMRMGGIWARQAGMSSR